MFFEKSGNTETDGIGMF